MGYDLVALENIETEALADFYRAAPPAMVAAHAIDTRSVAGARCFVCRDFNPTLMFRRVAGLGVARPATPADVDAVIAHMRGIGQPYAIAVGPHAGPRDLSTQLEARGFTAGYAWMKFARSCTAPFDVSNDVVVRPVGAEFAEAFGRIVVAGFGLAPAMAPWIGALPGRDGWLCIGAFLGTEPVGAAAAYIAAGYAWLGFAATLPDHRRRGAQQAMLALRLREAAVRGAHTAVVETGERLPDKPSNSYRNILRAGFEEIYLRKNYLSPAPR
ncbi:MAG: hypothetical protein ACJ8KA_13550 [Sulfurifustis sp.]